MESSKCPTLKIVIIGGGLAGLSSALAIARHPKTKHHDIVVLERSEQQTIGSVLGVWSNCHRVLDHFGVYEEFQKRSTKNVLTRYIRRWDNGEVLANQVPKDMIKKYQYPTSNIHRSDLRQVFLEATKQYPSIHIRGDVDVIGIDVEDPSVKLLNGETLKADLIIGADGINSIVRRTLYPEHGRLDSEMDLFCCSIPYEKMEADPELAPLTKRRDFWLGPDAAIVSGAASREDGSRYYLELARYGEKGTAGVWNKEIDIAEVKSMFQGWDHRLLKALEMVDVKCRVWRMAYNGLEPSWVPEQGKGRIILTGDAAHAMLPHAGQGAGMGIEDSAALAESLARLNSPSDLYTCLRAWEDIRKPRVAFLQRQVKLFAHLYHLPDGPEQQDRDERWRQTANTAGPDIWDGKHIDEPPEQVLGPFWMPYLAGHDTVGYTNRKLDEILGSP